MFDVGMSDYFYVAITDTEMYQLVTTKEHKVLTAFTNLEQVKEKYFKLKDEYGDDVEALHRSMSVVRPAPTKSFEIGEQFLKECPDCHDILYEWDTEYEEMKSQEFKNKLKLKRKRK